MKTYTKFVWLLLLLAASGIAQASPNQWTAVALRGQCKLTLNPPNFESTEQAMAWQARSAPCIDYIIGWAGGIEGTLVLDAKTNTLETVAWEDGVKANQIAKVYLIYLQNHPEDENKPAHVALMHAMLDAGLVTLVSRGKDSGN